MLGADPTNKVKNGYALAFAVPCPLAEGLDDCAVLAFSSRAIRNARKLRQAQRLRLSFALARLRASLCWSLLPAQIKRAVDDRVARPL
jgi:hypothetical protein